MNGVIDYKTTIIFLIEGYPGFGNSCQNLKRQSTVFTKLLCSSGCSIRANSVGLHLFNKIFLKQSLLTPCQDRLQNQYQNAGSFKQLEI